MNTVSNALRGAQQRPTGAVDRRQRAIVLGAGGALGSALLEQTLAGARFKQVYAVVVAPLASAVRGFDTVPASHLARAAADTAFVVFERQRHANGREEAFARPRIEDLPALARALQSAGVRQLLVVVPHSAALLPHALKSGLASIDEAAVAALDFEHVVFLRAAAADARPLAAGLQRFAAWWWSQLRWMVPQRDQPVRAVRMADVVVQLALRLPAATAGTRVLPPEVLWAASQPKASGLVLDQWLAGAARDGAPTRR